MALPILYPDRKIAGTLLRAAEPLVPPPPFCRKSEKGAKKARQA